MAAGGPPPPLTWVWANPLPHGADLYDLASANGLTVQVGDRGQIYTSYDLDFWAPRASQTTKALRAVTFFGSRIIITGEEGTVITANVSNLTSFARADLGTTNWLEGLAASASLLVAVGDNGAVYTSATGTEWTLRPQPFSAWLRGAAYGGNLFAAVGEGGFIGVSSDGFNWRQRNSGTTKNLNRVAWVGSRFVAVGDQGTVLASVDAAAYSWVAVQRANAPTNDLYAVAGYSGSGSNLVLVAGAGEVRLLENNSLSWSNEMAASKALPAPDWTYYTASWDGALFLLGGRAGMIVEGFKTNRLATHLWVTRNDSIRAWLWDVARFPGLYVAAGDLGTVQTSDNGVVWDLEVTPDAATNAVLLGVGGKDGLMMVVGTQGTMLRSTNGVVWGAVTPKATESDLQGIALLRDLLVVTGSGGTILTSTDGLQWTNRTNALTSFLSSVAAYPGGLVAVGEAGAMVTSPDGISWEAHPRATTNWLYRIRYLGGQLVVVGQDGLILTSPDGVLWTPRASGTARWLTDVALLNGTYYAVGTQGTVLASPDAVDWREVIPPTSKSFYGAVTDDQQLITVGIEGAILRGQLSAVNLLRYGRSQGTNSFVFAGQPGQRFDLEYSPELTAWTNLVTLDFLDNSGLLIQTDSRTNAPPQEFYRALPQP